ncbi:Porin subfamily protein [Bosea robiniae]|uniref:Porin n=2 Tax=Bosea robiniae TaxID=1036780 RepID=A0ABY0P8N2_9HYPH|nr:Porin subfamily protein [Bosea robiniae]
MFVPKRILPDEKRVPPVRRGALSIATRMHAATALAAICIPVFASPHALAASKPPLFLRSCTITPPEPSPVFSFPAASKPAAVSDDEDDDEDDESPHGFVSPGLGACVAVSGTVNAGLQRDSYKANALARATGLVPQGAISFPLSASFRIETGQTLSDGHYLASAFEFSIDTSSDGGSELTMSEASVTFGAFAFGLAGSRFDFWTGDDFAFIGRIPSRTVALIGYERQLTEQLSLSLSVEDTSADRRTVLPNRGNRVPDGVARLLYEQDGLTLHGAIAVRDVPGGGSGRVGRAAILGATWEKTLLDRPLTLTAQIAGAVDAAPYIGSRLDQRTAFSALTGDLTTRGWSGVVAIGREWTDEWSTNTYVSRYRLSIPTSSGLAGLIQIDRVAANLVWAPVDGLRIGLEGSIAWQKLDIAGNARAASLSGRQSSAQLFFERTF